MPVSGKTSPDEIPFLLGSDIPDMGAGDKAIAERVQAILGEEGRQPLSWLENGTKKQIIVCNSSGVPQYVTLGGDATIDEEGGFQLGSKVVGTNELGDGAVTPTKLADEAVPAAKAKLLLHSEAQAGFIEPGHMNYETLVTETPAAGSYLVVGSAVTICPAGGGALKSTSGLLGLEVDGVMKREERTGQIRQEEGGEALSGRTTTVSALVTVDGTDAIALRGKRGNGVGAINFLQGALLIYGLKS